MVRDAVGSILVVNDSAFDNFLNSSNFDWSYLFFISRFCALFGNCFNNFFDSLDLFDFDFKVISA